MKFKFTKNKKKISAKSLGQTFLNVWMNVFIYIAWAFIAMSIAFVVYIGYNALFGERDFGLEQQVYVQGQEAKVRFNQDNYDALQNSIKKRNERAGEQLRAIPDIFYTPGVGDAQ